MSHELVGLTEAEKKEHYYEEDPELTGHPLVGCWGSPSPRGTGRIRSLMTVLALLVACGPAFSQAAAVKQTGVIFLSVISGVYAQDQVLRVEPVGPQTSLRYSIRDTDGAEGPWVPFREALTLSAAPCEEREYRVIVRADSDAGEIDRREVWIRIDKKPPAPPRLSPEPGTTGTRWAWSSTRESSTRCSTR